MVAGAGPGDPDTQVQPGKAAGTEPHDLRGQVLSSPAPPRSADVAWLRLGQVIAVPVGKRSIVVAAMVAALTVVLAVATLSIGSLGLSMGQFVDALAGREDAQAEFVLQRLRGPRALVAIGAGAALGLSGALFQTVTRNPLGSPDVIGLGAGAGAGVAAMSLFWPGAASAPVGALIGAGCAILLVYFSTGLGFASPARVILTGIGVAAMAHSITQYVVAVELRDQAAQLAAYLVGSLNARSPGHVLTIAIVLATATPAVVALSHRLIPMDSSDALTDALGARAKQTRTLAIVLAVVLAAGAVAVCGPIAFVALTAPHIARRLTSRPGPNLCVSALVGALIMVGADLTVQHLPWFDGLPVGVITAGLGGAYLGYLLIREWKRSDA